MTLNAEPTYLYSVGPLTGVNITVSFACLYIFLILMDFLVQDNNVVRQLGSQTSSQDW